MTLNDLKTGMIVKTRDGDSHIVMRNYLGRSDILAGLSDSNSISKKWNHLFTYNEDMTHPNYSEMDIMEVYDSQPFSIDNIRYLIWKRKEHNDGWIPCSERLPENDDDVLCWYEYRIMQGTHEGEMNQKFEIGYYNKYFKRWGGEVSSGRDCKVIAWKPLPEPYKEDEEE